ncbi:hypothetical protein ACLOJK_012320 [Asimina triloba]
MESNNSITANPSRPPTANPAMARQSIAMKRLNLKSSGKGTDPVWQLNPSSEATEDTHPHQLIDFRKGAQITDQSNQ